MNKVLLNGKITNVTTLEKVVYATILVHTKTGGEFIQVTIFNTDFFNKYFYKGKWISVEGHLHMNDKSKNSEYAKMEIIADEIHFSGNLSDFDKFVNEQYAQNNNVQ